VEELLDALQPESPGADRLVVPEGVAAELVMYAPDSGSGGGVYPSFATGRLPPTHRDHLNATGTLEHVHELVSPLGALRSAYMEATGEEPQVTSRDVYVGSCIDFI